MRIFQAVSLDTGAQLVRQGAPADGAWIIESGEAEVITALPGGGEAVVARLGPGSVLGEMALLESGIRSATVVARAPVFRFWLVTTTMRSGASKGIGRRTTALTTLKIAVVAPMPSASVRMAVAANPGCRVNVRTP